MYARLTSPELAARLREHALTDDQITAGTSVAICHGDPSDPAGEIDVIMIVMVHSFDPATRTITYDLENDDHTGLEEDKDYFGDCTLADGQFAVNYGPIASYFQ